MRYIITLLVTGLVITACNNDSSKKETTSDTTPTAPPVIPNTSQQNDTLFRAIGTEPFWGVYLLSNSTIVFHPAEGADVIEPLVSRAQQNDSTEKYTTRSIELIKTMDPCSDGMSEQNWPFSVQLIVNGKAYKGCGKTSN